jgi:hypothetical protein
MILQQNTFFDFWYADVGTTFAQHYFWSSSAFILHHKIVERRLTDVLVFAKLCFATGM